ncbi:hypothetical protein B0T17DRAFT_521245 [Bombardia bombarda]|uniref:Uncharacterized protein n=1 Tax=Bombardia bombarda TaxID=252184 RepID=A0AA39XPB2_9PEZI|nr:hypothetical protein B0T17DRAFT_521245 [Bombardia bombarda]
MYWLWRLLCPFQIGAFRVRLTNCPGGCFNESEARQRVKNLEIKRPVTKKDFSRSPILQSIYVDLWSLYSFCWPGDW